MQNAVSSQKQLSVVFGVANAQKQGVMGARLVLASSTTMFQELVQNAELARLVLASSTTMFQELVQNAELPYCFEFLIVPALFP